MTVAKIEPKLLNEWIMLIGRIVTPIGIVILILLQTQFANKADVDVLKNQVNKLETAVMLLIEQQKQMQAYDTKLEQIDTRTRSIEIQLAKLTK